MPPQVDGKTYPETDQNEFHFNINGKIYKVDSSIPPTMTLLQFLREKASLTGTKGLCYEGGCGICNVVATFKDPETGKQKTCGIKSCQTLVYSCAGWGIETIERLGNRYKGYHSLQKALVGFSGTQCGFCSPGFVMTMYGELKSKGKLTMDEVEKAMDGNLCRCTGYRPILDAFKSFASDGPEHLKKKLVDIEDSYNTICPNTGELCKGKCTDSSSDAGCTKKLEMENLIPKSEIHISSGKVTWLRPMSIEGVYDVLQKSSSNQKVRFVVGNTGEGIYKDGPFDVFVDITAIEELYAVAIGKPLVIGANISLQRCLQIFREMASTYSGYEYLNQLADHWENIGNVGVRNTGSWAGNLMLKNKHKEFPSDIFVTLAAVGTSVTVGNSANSSTSEVSVEELVKMDLDKSLILSMKLLPQSENTFIRTYKITPRAVNSHAYVNAAFKFEVDKDDGDKLLSKPAIIFGGINPGFVHAKETENFLNDRRLSVDTILFGALNRIGTEVNPDSKPADATPAYRTLLSQSLFYKAVLDILGDSVSPEFRSGASILHRPVSSGTQKYDENKDSWPVGKPIPKIEAAMQVSGEAEYLDDIEPLNGELFGAFVQTTIASAELGPVDPSEALKVPGVVAYINANDIPGQNSFAYYGEIDPVFTSSKIDYAGQSIGLIVAEDRSVAERAAKLVKIEYKNPKKPILTFKDALKKQLKEEEPSKKFEDIPHTVEGGFEQGSQFNFPMEPLAARIVPIEDGYDVFATTQWPASTQAVVANVLGIKSNSINISVRRLGGGFGGKISRQNVVVSAAAVAAHKLQRPVRIVLDLKTHMTLVGWRDPYMAKYKVGFDDEGLLKQTSMWLYSDAGANKNEATVTYAYKYAPSVYYSKKWAFGYESIKTDTAPNTYCRAPATPNAIAFMENIIERVADYLHKDPVEIREKNFFNKSAGHTGPINHEENLVRTRIFPMLKETSSYEARKKEIELFNKANRWTKRGLSMIPLYYGINYPKSFRYNTQVAIYSDDGTVVIGHGGIEMGQGLNTKIVQAAARSLKVPLELIKVKPSNLFVGANSAVTGGSFGSDLVAHGIQKTCEKLRARMDVVEKKIEGETKKKPSWQELVSACMIYDVDLSERYWTAGNEHPDSYDVYAGVCMEVELDVLTGQYMMKRTDLIEDCGRAMSPLVDIGQVEGGFVMGLGLYTSELVKYDPQTGRKLSDGTWEYKPPTALDIPTDFRITLLPNADNKKGVLRSKATGEPPVCMAYVVVSALRQAIKSAREDAGHHGWFEITTPLTVERVHDLCKVDPKDFLLQTRKARMEDSEDFQMKEFLLPPNETLHALEPDQLKQESKTSFTKF